MRDQSARAVRHLPPTSTPPILNKADADSQPIFGLSLESERRTQLELERVRGLAARASADRARHRAARCSPPKNVMRCACGWIRRGSRAYGLSPLDVRAALNRENVELPSGRIEGDAVELAGQDAVAAQHAGRVQRPHRSNAAATASCAFGDIGRAELGAAERARRAEGRQYADRRAVLQAAAGREPDRDRRRAAPPAAQIEREVPDDITVDVAFDNTEYVRRSLLEVSETILIAFVLVVLVVFAFLREWRTTLIPVIAIPVSIVGAFGVMARGGILHQYADAARHRARDRPRRGRCHRRAREHLREDRERPRAVRRCRQAGTNEIFMAVISTTITLVVVFLPLLFMGGMSGRLFREFGMTIAGAVLISAAGRADLDADARRAAAQGAASAEAGCSRRRSRCSARSIAITAAPSNGSFASRRSRCSSSVSRAA